MPKIVFVTTGLSIGGAELMLQRLLERLDRRFDTHVISMTSLGEVGEQMKGSGVSVEALGMRRGIPDLVAFSRLVRRLKELRPAAVQTWMYHADLMGGLAARVARVPKVIWSIRHGDLSPHKNKALTLSVVSVCALLSRWVPNLILCCSERAAQTHVAKGYARHKMRVIPNGIDVTRFRFDDKARKEVRAEVGFESSASLVGNVGRFDPLKNQTGFLDAFAELARRVPHARALMVGEGVDQNNSALVRRAEELAVFGKVKFVGRRDDLHRVMSALDVLMSSSHGEAFPNVIAEAMACGVPCAVTDVGDSAWIAGDTGRVVAPGDMRALAIAATELLSIPEGERVTARARAREHITSQFDIEVVVKRYERVFDELSAASAGKH
jgi:glycosyltransferase involved in cell wall biosynthesis